MNLFVCGLRRSGTTILYDALSEDPELRCFYEPLREDTETIGGGSGARNEDAFAETRALREEFRRERYPHLPIEHFNVGGPADPEAELDPALPEHAAALIAFLLEQAANVAIKETRLHHKVGAIAEIDPDAAVVHIVRDPRAVCASMLLGRRRRTDIYPDPDTFFTARTGRRLWSSRRISEAIIASRSSLGLPADVPDFVRPLAVWQSAFEATHGDGSRLFGDRYVLVRLEDLRANPGAELGRIYAACGRDAPEPVRRWAAENVRREARVHLAGDPRWAQAARALHLEEALTEAGYEEILELSPATADPLDLTPPKPRSPLSGLVGRARRRLG